ncbi:hypothetical protein L1887_25441 [Cichorium endivia]|nr:hypothetical protein L1887_25441 [Cichorium endivia]
MSTISSIILINSFGVKDLSQLEEKTLPFGKDEVIAKWRPEEARMPDLIDAPVFYPTEKGNNSRDDHRNGNDDDSVAQMKAAEEALATKGKFRWMQIGFSISANWILARSRLDGDTSSTGGGVGSGGNSGGRGSIRGTEEGLLAGEEGR